MENNVGGQEKAVRLGVAAALAAAGLVAGGSARPRLLALASISALSVAFHYCPMNQLVGRDTFSGSEAAPAASSPVPPL